MKSTFSTNARVLWRTITITSPQDAAISGAPPAPGRRTFGCVVVAADHGRVDVGEAVDLRRAEEADVDPAGLHPVVEDLRHGDDVVGGLAEDAVADRERQPRRLGADRAGLVDEHEVRARACAARGSRPCSAGRSRRSRRSRPSARGRRRCSSSRRLRRLTAHLLEPGVELLAVLGDRVPGAVGRVVAVVVVLRRRTAWRRPAPRDTRVTTQRGSTTPLGRGLELVDDLLDGDDRALGAQHGLLLHARSGPTAGRCPAGRPAGRG